MQTVRGIASKYFPGWNDREDFAQRVRQNNAAVVAYLDNPHQAKDESEALGMRGAWRFIKTVQASRFDRYEAGKLIFCERWCVAAHVDMVTWGVDGTVKLMTFVPWQLRETKQMAQVPVHDICNCEECRYQVELNMCEQIMRREGLIRPDDTVEKWVGSIDECKDALIWSQAPCMTPGALLLLLEGVTIDPDSVPF